MNNYVILIFLGTLLPWVQGQNCTQPKEFSTCASACVTTCTFKPEVCIAVCVEACACPKELIQEGDECVLETNCPGASCPSGITRQDCLVDPCTTASCPLHSDAVCIKDDCGECMARFFKDGKEVTDTCQQCPDGSNPVTCFAEPCSVSSCELFPTASCTNDYCGGCQARYYLSNGTEVTKKCRANCEAPKEFSNCASACEPNCNSSAFQVCTEQCVSKCRCPKPMVEASPTNSTCVEKSECPGQQCPDGSNHVNCFAEPCSVSSCDMFPTASCTNDYCGGCQARFYLSNGTEVTDNCSANCEAPKEFSSCASACEPTCDTQDGEPCTLQCVRKCRCPSPLVEVSATNSTCIEKANCPGGGGVPIVVPVVAGVVVTAVVIVAAVCLML